MATLMRVLDDGPRNYILAFYTDIGGTYTIGPVATLTPPCRTLKLRRLTYDVGAGDSMEVFLEATPNVGIMKLTEGNGQTAEYKEVGGIISSLAFPGATGNIILTVVLTGAPKSVSALFHFTKKY